VEPRTIVALDVGTSKVCTLVGEAHPNGQLRIIGVGVTPSRGLRKGVVVDVQEATEAIKASVYKAQKLSGHEITSAYVGIGGGYISATNSKGMTAISRSERGITHLDVDKALASAKTIAMPYNREIIHAIPRDFILDGQEGVRDPIGMHGVRLEVEAHIVTGASTSVNNLVKCVRDAGLEIDELILQPLASGEAVLREEERDLGVILADVGGGTSDIAVFIRGSIWHTHILQIGGQHFTRDVAVGLRTPLRTAEELKINYGQAQASTLEMEELIEVRGFGDGMRQSVSRLHLAQILEARAEEILLLTLQEIKRSGYDGLLAAGMVMCGGSSELTEFSDLARNVLQIPVRVGRPYGPQGLTDVLESPAYATSVGLLLWAMRHGQEEVQTPVVREESIWLKRVRDWLRAFLPG
jgi:cell division protein FtsA